MMMMMMESSMDILKPLLVLMGFVASAMCDDVALRRLGDSGTFNDGEAFISRCQINEVVVVTSATLEQSTGGRIKCDVTPSPASSTCVRDVRSHLDEKCSGQPSCQFVPSELCRTLNGTCDASSAVSLKMSYDCLRAVSRDCSDTCGSNDQLTRLTSPEGYLVSTVTSEKRCGSSQCPWFIQVPPGQAINITLLDFSGGEKRTVARGGGARASGSEGGCVTIKEKANPKEVVECVGKTRERLIYSTVSNTLELRLNVKDSRFLIHYKAIGCPDIVPPRNSRMKRTGNECEIDCPGTNLKWVMMCEENKWVGDSVGKCPGGDFGPVAAPNPQQSESSFSLPTGILIAVVVALTVIIAVLVLTIGFVCLKKHQYETKLGEPVLYGAPCSEFEFCDEFSNMHRPGAPKTGTSTAGTRSRVPRSGADPRDNTYAADQQFEMQPLQRPLPSIPGDGRCGSWRPNDQRRIVVQLHPSNSGAGTMSIIQPYPTMMARDGGRLPCNCGGTLKAHPSTGSVYRPPSHLYFTLDPEVQVEEPATPAEGYPSLGHPTRGGGGAPENQTISRLQQRALMGPGHGSAAMASGEAIHVNPQDLVPLNLTNRSRQQANNHPATTANQIQAASHMATPANQYPSNRIRADGDANPMSNNRLPENPFPMNLSFDAQQNLQQKRIPPSATTAAVCVEPIAHS